MLSGISWKEFIATIVIFLVIYYLVILLIYYRSDISQLLKEGVRKKQINPEQLPETSIPSDFVSSASENNQHETVLFSAVHDLMEELKELFAIASKKKQMKEELLMALQVKLRSYQQLKNTGFQVAVNNHIIQQSKEWCAIDLQESELKHIW